MFVKDFKIDVIVPTADASKWPAKESIEWNKKRARNYPEVKFIPIESSGPNFSFSKSVNRGIAEAREDSDILLLNDDCFMDALWPMRFWAARISHKDCGLFGALLSFPSDFDVHSHGNLYSGKGALNHWKPEYQHAGGYIPLTMKEMLYGVVRFGVWNASPLFILRQGIKVPESALRFPGHYHNLSLRNRIDLVTAACMLITRPALNKLGGFDESYPLGFEDTDYCLKAREAGIRLCLVTDCHGSHYESLTTRHLEDKKRDSYRIFHKNWPRERLFRAINDTEPTVVHPKYCSCGVWIE